MANRALEVFCLAATVLCDKLEECDEHSSSEREMMSWPGSAGSRISEIDVNGQKPRDNSQKSR